MFYIKLPDKEYYGIFCFMSDALLMMSGIKAFKDNVKSNTNDKTSGADRFYYRV
jgi:hypothetical protein